MTSRFETDPDAVAADDRLLDLIGGRLVLSDTSDAAASALVGWVSAVDAPPAATWDISDVITAALVGIAATKDYQESPGRNARRRLMLAVAASACGLLVLSGVNAARPGDPLWPVAVALDSNRASSLSAKQKVMGHVQAANRYLGNGLYLLAGQEIKLAKEILHDVRPEDGRLELSERIDSLSTAIAAALVSGNTGADLDPVDKDPGQPGAAPAAPGADGQSIAPMDSAVDQYAVPPVQQKSVDVPGSAATTKEASSNGRRSGGATPARPVKNNAKDPVSDGNGPKPDSPSPNSDGAGNGSSGNGGSGAAPNKPKPGMSQPQPAEPKPAKPQPNKPGASPLPGIPRPPTVPGPGNGDPGYEIPAPPLEPEVPPVVAPSEPVDPPVVEPVDPPVVEPVDPPVDPPVVEPVDPPVDPPVVEPVDPPVDPPVVEPVDPPVDPPVVEPVDPPVDPPVVQPVDPPVDPPVVEPVDPPVVEPVDPPPTTP